MNKLNFPFDEIEKIIGYKFKDKTLLLTAFTHTSFSNENQCESYERLEFLGDGLLDYVIGTILFYRFKDKDPGYLSKARAGIVDATTLSQIIDNLNLIQYMRCGRGLERSKILTSESMKSDLFESIIGAILVDNKFKNDMAYAYIVKHLDHTITPGYFKDFKKDYKSAFIEHCTKNKLDMSFKFSEDKAESPPVFSVLIIIDSEIIADGVDVSKKKAEQLACKDAYLKIVDLASL